MSDLLKSIIYRNKDFININEYKKNFSKELPKESFTFRIHPISKSILEKHAELLEISTGQIINLILDEFINLLDKSHEENSSSFVSKKKLLENLRCVLHQHGYNSSKLIEFFSYFDIQVSDLINDDFLIKRLNYKKITEILSQFNISINWLFGFSEVCYQHYYNSECSGNFFDFINGCDESDRFVILSDLENNQVMFIRMREINIGVLTHEKKSIFYFHDLSDDKIKKIFDEGMNLLVLLSKEDNISLDFFKAKPYFMEQYSLGKKVISINTIEQECLLETLSKTTLEAIENMYHGKVTNEENN